MSVKGKRKYSLYLDEKNADYVLSFLERAKNKGGLSALVDTYIATMAKTLRMSDYKSGEKMSFAKVFRIGLNGFRQTT